MGQTFFYNWRKIDGYNAPVTVVIGQRGLGKTFGKVYDVLRDFVEIPTNPRFVYVVETLDDVKILSQNKGERFFAGVKEYLENERTKSKRKQKLYSALFSSQKETSIDEGETDLIGESNEKILGGTIKIQGKTAGYLIAINSYGNLKRNNFVNIKTIIIDEFIPEQIDIRHLQMARKVASVIQTIARRNYVKIYMLGNSIRLDDILLVKLKLDNLKLGEIRTIKDKKGILVVAHYVDPKQYAEFTDMSANSVAGRLATLLGEDNLDRNQFKQDLPENLTIPAKPKASHLLFCLHDNIDSVRVNVTKDHNQLYVLSDYGKNARERICFDQKYISNVVKYQPEWKDYLLNKYENGEILFESGVIHLLFKKILKLELN